MKDLHLAMKRQGIDNITMAEELVEAGEKVVEAVRNCIDSLKIEDIRKYRAEIGTELAKFEVLMAVTKQHYGFVTESEFKAYRDKALNALCSKYVVEEEEEDFSSMEF